MAWTGGARSGTVRLEIGAGAYEGTTVVVQADEGVVRVVLGGASAGHLEPLRERIRARLAMHGLTVTSVE
jgi:hypothetical protein